MKSGSQHVCVSIRDRDILDSHNLAVVHPELYYRSCEQSREKSLSESGASMPQSGGREALPEWAVQIAKFKEDMGLTQQAFAVKLGVTQQIVSSWLAGKKEPKPATYFRMIRLSPSAQSAAFLMKRAAELSGSIQIAGLEKMFEVRKPVRNADGSRFGHLSTDTVTVPVLRDAAAAGTPRQIDEREIEQVMPISASLCPHPDHTVCVKVEGDSMSPMLLDGYIVAVDTAQQDAHRLVNQMVAARGPDGGVTIKWLRKVGKDLLLIPQHTSKRHQPVILTPRAGEESSRWSIVGKVLWWIGMPE